MHAVRLRERINLLLEVAQSNETKLSAVSPGVHMCFFPATLLDNFFFSVFLEKDISHEMLGCFS